MSGAVVVVVVVVVVLELDEVDVLEEELELPDDVLVDAVAPAVYIFNFCPTLITEFESKPFKAMNSARVIPFFLEMLYMVSPFTTVYSFVALVEESVAVPEVVALLSVARAAALLISAEGILSFCPTLITSFSERLLAARSSATVIWYLRLIEYKVSPFSTL